METNQLLAVSLQTWRTVALVCTAEGESVASAGVRHEAQTPATGLAELPVQSVWDAVCGSVRTVLASEGVRPAEIRAVAVSSDPATIVPLDAQGQPLQNAILPQDRRAAKAAQALAEAVGVQEFQRTTGLHRIGEGSVPAKLRWLAENAAKRHAQTARYALMQDYVIARLGGHPAVARSAAALTGLYDIHRNVWWPRLLDALGLRAEQWPEVRDAGEAAGELDERAAEQLGLPRGIPVAVGPANTCAAALGAGAVAPGCLVDTLLEGTMAMAVTDRPVLDAKGRVSTCPYESDLWMVTPWVDSVGGMLAWYRQTFAPQLAYNQLDGLAGEAPPGCEGLLVVPQPGASPRNGSPPCMVAGLLPRHGKAHLVRAILESDACALRERVDLLNSLKVPVNRIHVVGGAANSALWLQIKADLLGLPVVQPAVVQCAGLGTAMCAAVAAGLFENPAQAARAMHRTARVFEPAAAARPVYQELYERYRKLLRALSA